MRHSNDTLVVGNERRDLFLAAVGKKYHLVVSNIKKIPQLRSSNMVNLRTGGDARLSPGVHIAFEVGDLRGDNLERRTKRSNRNSCSYRTGENIFSRNEEKIRRS